MGTFSATANSSSTIGYAQYGSSSWSTGSSSGACQGAYQGTTAAKSRVGVMVFSGAGAALKGKLIQNITLTITSSGAGSGSSSKKLTFCQANYQSPNTGVRGSAQVGATMGTLTGKFYSNTVTHTLNASSNAALFTAMKAYFEAGNSVLVLYNGETSSSSGYSSNYARVTSCTISVTYIDAVVWYRDGGTWASYRLFHAGMATPIPLANGGTGASSAKAALSNLGIFYSASLPSSGTDGQICLVPV